MNSEPQGGSRGTHLLPDDQGLPQSLYRMDSLFYSIIFVFGASASASAATHYEQFSYTF